MAPITPGIVPFPLYHGSSSHYLDAFRRGAAPAGWPHKDSAITLFRNVWNALRLLGVEPDGYIQYMLDQVGGHSNWQHGDLYVTPSRHSAVRYAGANASYGGELLTECKNALDLLAKSDPRRMTSLLSDTELIADFLNGNGTPILIEITNVCVDDLMPESANDGSVTETLSELAKLDDRRRDAIGQQMNFRLKRCCGVVRRVFSLKIDDPYYPLSPYQATEI
jgi:hypothetical protein